MTAVANPSTTAAPPRARARRVAARGWAALLLAMFIVPAIPTLVTAWTSTLHEGTHVIHDLAHVAHLVLLMGPALLIALLGRAGAAPAQTVLASFLIPLPVAILGGLLTPSEAAVPAVMVTVLVLLLSGRGRLLAGARPSPVLLGLAAAVSAPLLWFAVGQLRLQAVLPASEPHAAFGHWAGMAFWAASLICLALLVALRFPGWRLPLYSGAAGSALVAVGSLVHPSMPSSLGMVGGIVALLATAGFAAAAELLDRRDREAERSRVPAAARGAV
jgi:hypothetical protein